MARVDDYIAAKKIAVQALSQKPFERLVEMTGFKSTRDDVFQIPFLNRNYQVSYPDFEFSELQVTNREIPIQEQVLILHYMMPDRIPAPTGNWVAYREIPGASFYYSAFSKRAVQPMVKTFGQNVDGLIGAAGQLHGIPIETGDAAFEFRVLPKIPLQLILWQGDDEFPPEASILFDESIGAILSPEDAAWLPSLLVYRLIALSYQ